MKFNHKVYTVAVSAHDQLDYEFYIESSYQPTYKSVLQEIIDYVDNGCGDWPKTATPLAKMDFGSMHSAICRKIVEKMLVDQDYRQEMIDDLTSNMNQMFEFAKSKKLSEEEKRMCLNSAKGIEKYLPNILAKLKVAGTVDQAQLVDEVTTDLYAISLMHFTVVTIDSVEVK